MIQDVTGMTLGEAQKLLEAAGLTGIEIRITAPPRDMDRQYGPDSRVVRQLVREAADGGTEVELVVCKVRDIEKKG